MHPTLRYLLPLVLLSACTETLDVPAEVSQSALRVQGRPAVDRGALPIGIDTAITLEEHAASHVFQLDLSATATISLHTAADATDTDVDTVLSLYRLPLGSSVKPVARNDDADDSRFSALRKELKAGSYLVEVRGFKRTTRGSFVLHAECSGAGCPVVLRECAFGSTFHDLRNNARMQIDSESWITNVNQLASELEAQQLVLAVQQSSHTDVSTAEEALSRVDQQEVRHLPITDRQTGERYLVLEYGAGDSSYGAIFSAGSLSIAASIHDGDLLDCTVE